MESHHIACAVSTHQQLLFHVNVQPQDAHTKGRVCFSQQGSFLNIRSTLLHSTEVLVMTPCCRIVHIHEGNKRDSTNLVLIMFIRGQEGIDTPEAQGAIQSCCGYHSAVKT